MRVPLCVSRSEYPDRFRTRQTSCDSKGTARELAIHFAVLGDYCECSWVLGCPTQFKQPPPFQTALFVVAETLLLPLVKAAAANATLGVSDHIAHALLVLTYATILLGMSSAMSSLILIDEFGSITLRASRSQSTSQVDIYDMSSMNLLTRFNGGRGAWKLVVSHCMLRTLGASVAR